MLEPVALSDFFVSFFSAAMVIMAGAAYAILLTFSRLQNDRRLLIWAYVSYGLLAVSVFALAEALNLTGFWSAVVAAMLVGYFLAPRMIWQLCHATHPKTTDRDS